VGEKERVEKGILIELKAKKQRQVKGEERK